MFSTAWWTTACPSWPIVCWRRCANCSIGHSLVTSSRFHRAQASSHQRWKRSRDRVLDDDELRLVWQAADKIGWPFGPLIQLLTLTGQRRDEVGQMQWSEINIKKQLWTLPRERVKTDQPHEVPLSTAAIGILKSLPRSRGFVFSTNGRTPASGFSKAKRRIDALLPPDMAPWRLHDLRRTVASGMARLNINLPVIEKVLAHSSGSFAGIVGVYQRH